MFLSCSDPLKEAYQADLVAEAANVEQLKGYIAGECRSVGGDLFEAGEESFKNGQYGQAFNQWTRATQLIPDWDLPFLQLAFLHPLYDNNREAELEALDKAVTLRPGNPRSRLLYGTALHQAGQLEKAQAQLEEAIRLKPAYAEAHLRLANLYREQKMNGPAIELYAWLADHTPDNILVYSILATLYEQEGRLAQAEVALQRLVRLQTDIAAAYVRLAQFYDRIGRQPDAQKAFQRAEELKPAELRRKMRPLLPSKR